MTGFDLIASLLPFLLVGLGFVVGRLRERRHIESILRREAELAYIRISNLKSVPDAHHVKQAMLVSGDAVIASDYFKSFASGLRKMIGGEMRAYETLMDRARRESTLRMLQEARNVGAQEVWNVRWETSNIRSANGRNKAVSVEVFAFGTAVIRD